MAALSIVPILSALMCAAVTLDTVWMLTGTLVTVSTHVHVKIFNRFILLQTSMSVLKGSMPVLRIAITTLARTLAAVTLDTGFPVMDLPVTVRIPKL